MWSMTGAVGQLFFASANHDTLYQEMNAEVHFMHGYSPQSPVAHFRTALLTVAMALSVIFCVVLLTVPRATNAIKIDLPFPNLSHGPWAERPTDRVRIGADGRITLNGISCADPSDLGRRLAARQMLNPVPGVLVEPDANARYEDFLKALAAIKKTHVWRLCIDMKAGQPDSSRLRRAECDLPGPIL